MPNNNHHGTIRHQCSRGVHPMQARTLRRPGAVPARPPRAGCASGDEHQWRAANLFVAYSPHNEHEHHSVPLMMHVCGPQAHSSAASRPCRSATSTKRRGRGSCGNEDQRPAAHPFIANGLQDSVLLPNAHRTRTSSCATNLCVLPTGTFVCGVQALSHCDQHEEAWAQG